MKGIVSRAGVLIFCFLVAGGSWAHALEMVEGDWETISEMSFEMQGMSMPPQTTRVTQCLTREDAVPAKKEECKVTRQKIVGNTISWAVVCGKTEGEGEITYAPSGKSYQGTFKMKTEEDGETATKKGSKATSGRKKTEEGGETMTMVMKLSGKYLGPCPKGQKSGVTGEMAARQAQAEQAMAQSKQQQAEQEALRQKCEEFMKRAAVPAEDPNACAQEGFARTPDCEQKVGSLNLQYGLYEITVEQASRIGPNCILQEEKRKKEEKRKTVCLNEDDPVPPDLKAGRQVRKVKRGKDKITWKDTYEGGETRGGVVYSGTSFEGVAIQKGSAGPGMEQLHVTKVTGRRVGDGNCPKGWEYTSKGRSDAATGGSKGKQQSPSGTRGTAETPQTQTPETPSTGKEKPSDSGKGTVENPVKEIRKLFGF